MSTNSLGHRSYQKSKDNPQKINGIHIGRKMLEVGTIISKLEIFEIVFGGDGVARLEDGAIIFVPFSAVGDILTVEITDARKNFYKGWIVSIDKPGPGRAEPICPNFGRCGGCAYQHLDYSAELQAKALQFASVMKRIGHFDDFPQIEKFVNSPQRTGYRNKLRLEPILASRKKEQKGKRPPSISYGFCERDNRTFFQVSKCPLAKDELNAAIKEHLKCAYAVQNARRDTPYPMTLRIDSTGKCASYFGRASANLPWFKEMLLGNEVRVPVGSFWQVNSAVAGELLLTIRQWLQEVQASTLIDAYAGVGTFSLALGDMFQFRIVIESDEQAIAASKHNHEQRGLDGDFIAGTTEDALGNALQKVKNSDAVVVLDPPRTGCLPKVISTLLAMKPATLIYVSCNPSTLARDLKLLCENGTYHPVRCAAFDMFPSTAHFESAVLLQTK